LRKLKKPRTIFTNNSIVKKIIRDDKGRIFAVSAKYPKTAQEFRIDTRAVILPQAVLQANNRIT